jgi:hypothetical protein
VNDWTTAVGSTIDAGSHRIVFLYLSGAPKKTTRKIERFYKSIKSAYKSAEFRVVSYTENSKAGTFELEVRDFSIIHHIYNRESLRGLNYPSRVSHGRFNFTHDGCVDLPIILFWRDNPDFDRYWVSEDDVEYTGDIGSLLRWLDRTDEGAELSCTHVRLVPDNWNYLHTFSSGDDRLSDEMPRRVCFLPFFCVSPKALAAIDTAYKRGWAGYNEMTWAIILDYAGMSIRDIGGAGPYVAKEYHNCCYIDRSPNDFSKRGSFGTLRIRLFPGRSRNMLWHPVKTPSAWVRMTRRRLKSIFLWYRAQAIVVCRGLLANLRVGRR